MLASSFEHRFENLRANSLDREVAANSELEMYSKHLHRSRNAEYLTDR